MKNRSTQSCANDDRRAHVWVGQKLPTLQNKNKHKYTKATDRLPLVTQDACEGKLLEKFAEHEEKIVADDFAEFTLELLDEPVPGPTLHDAWPAKNANYQSTNTS